MNHIIRVLLAAILGIVLLPGCSRDEAAVPQSGATRSVGIRFKTVSSDMADDDATISKVRAYHFEEGVLREILTPMSDDGAGTCLFSLANASGELRFVANGTAIGAFDLPEGTSLEDFLDIVLPTEQMTSDGMLLTGRLELGTSNSEVVDVSLRRSVARLDLVTSDQGVRVHGVTLRGMADRGYAVGRETVATAPEAVTTSEFTRDWSEAPLENTREQLLYLSEQSDARIEAEVLVEIDGAWHRLRAQLPAEILRNRIYTLQVQGIGTSAQLVVTSGDWEAGDSIVAEQLPGGMVDIEASDIPVDVQVNSTCDSLIIPYTPTSLNLVLRAAAGSELVIHGSAHQATVTPVQLTRALEPVVGVEVQTRLRMPGNATEYVMLDLLHDGVARGRVVLCFAPNPLQVEGSLHFDDSALCDYGTYVEGELARLTPLAGQTLRLEFAGEESPWMKLVPDGDSYRLLGGWKPNDPTATGREQDGTLVVTGADGSTVERYTVRRRNWGLPVVRIGNTWWCKYNLRGDATRFEDQITLANDPVASADLADYLAAADDAELLDLLGDQYQGGNIQGLPLRHNGTAYYYEGVAGSAQNFGTLDPSSMAPAGYRIPGYDDFAYLSRNENYNLGSVGDHSYTNASGNPLSVRIIQRQATFLEQNYGPVMLYEFHEGDSVWVLCGLGHQWDTTAGNIAKLQLLFATTGNSSKCWVMEGHAQTESANGNWLKFMANNAKKTRTLRCVKAPVEYEYQ